MKVTLRAKGVTGEERKIIDDVKTIDASSAIFIIMLSTIVGSIIGIFIFTFLIYPVNYILESVRQNGRRLGCFHPSTME